MQNIIIAKINKTSKHKFGSFIYFFIGYYINYIPVNIEKQDLY